MSWGQKKIVGKRTTNTIINSTPPKQGEQAFPVGFVDTVLRFPSFYFTLKVEQVLLQAKFPTLL